VGGQHQLEGPQVPLALLKVLVGNLHEVGVSPTPNIEFHGGLNTPE